MELTIRLGHAYRGDSTRSSDDELRLVIDILTGQAALQPRLPKMVKAVTDAETILNIAAPVIYTFIGCLHPTLGELVWSYRPPVCTVGFKALLDAILEA